VHTDVDGATGLPGLFAAGEVACVSINGANRLGSNSLPELLVFGRRAGLAAAEQAADAAEPGPAVLAQASDERRRLERELLAPRDGPDRIADIRAEMHRTMELSAGIYRDARSLAEGADKLRELQERFARVTIQDASRTFNTELVAGLELSFMLDVAETMIACALRREESRGAHQRTDFPARDDERFLAHSMVTREQAGTPRIDYLPVTITRWPPGERVYGR
jgi:fumarate reductase flavoprotein subunit